MIELSNFLIELPKDRIKNRLKIPRNANFNDYDHLIEKFFTLVEPHARYDHINIETINKTIVFEDSYRIISGSLANHLSDCYRITITGITIGKWLEEEIEEYKKKKRSLESLILDAVGSECAEETAQYISAIIDNEIKNNNCSPTKRFSPGYGDLSLEVQKYFFQKLKLEEIGMSLTPTLLMIPKKSITAFIGWRNA